MKITVRPSMDIVGIKLFVSYENREIMKRKILDKLHKHRLKWQLTI